MLSFHSALSRHPPVPASALSRLSRPARQACQIAPTLYFDMVTDVFFMVGLPEIRTGDNLPNRICKIIGRIRSCRRKGHVLVGWLEFLTRPAVHLKSIPKRFEVRMAQLSDCMGENKKTARLTKVVRPRCWPRSARTSLGHRHRHCNFSLQGDLERDTLEGAGRE
jgi:hypothetical protein